MLSRKTNTVQGMGQEEVRATDHGLGRSEDSGEGDAYTNIGESTLFLKLREQSIRQVTEMMDSTIASMVRLEKSMDRISSSTSGVVSAARIWSSFYDPMVVEKLKEESVNEKNSTNSANFDADKNASSSQAQVPTDGDMV